MTFSADDFQHYPLRVDGLPQSWVVTNIASISKAVQPGFPSGRHNAEGRGIPHLRPMNVSREGAIDLTEVKYVSGEAPQRLSDGDVLFNNTNSPVLVGKTAVVRHPGEWAYSNHMTRVVPSPGIVPEYIAFHLHYLWMSGYFRHRCINHVNQASISSGPLAATVPIALPPTAEQERIVAAMEEEFSRLDAGVAALERVRLNLKRMRTAAYDRFERGATALAPPTPLSEVTEFIVDGDHNPPKRSDAGIPYLTAKHVKRGCVSTANATCISDAEFERMRKRYNPRPGDVLLTCVGTLGETAVVPEGLVFAADRNLIGLRPTSDLRPRFLEALLRAPRTRRALVDGSGSTAQPHLYLKDVRALTVHVPTRTDQDALIARLDQTLSAVADTDSAMSAGELRHEQLRVAIFAAAFAGQLVSQNHDDEPASILLARLASERASQSATGPPRKPRTKATA